MDGLNQFPESFHWITLLLLRDKSTRRGLGETGCWEKPVAIERSWFKTRQIIHDHMGDPRIIHLVKEARQEYVPCGSIYVKLEKR